MIKALVIDSERKKTREQHQVANTKDLPLLIKLKAALALPIVSSTIQYKSHYMGTLP